MKPVLTQHNSKRKGSFGEWPEEQLEEGGGQGPKRHRQVGRQLQ